MIRSAGASGQAGARLGHGLFIAVGLSWGSGLIHDQAAVWHLDEYVPFAIAFAVLAAIQFAWGAAVYWCPRPWLLGAGAALSLGVAAVWVASRTTGLPIGPEPWEPERIGLADVIATADEAVLCLLVLVHFVSRAGRPVSRTLDVALAALGLSLLSLSSLSFMFGDHAH